MTQPNSSPPGPSNGVGKKPTKKQSCCGCLLIMVVLLAVLAGIGALAGSGDDDTSEAVSSPSPTVTDTPSPSPTGTEDEEPSEEPTEEPETPTPTPRPSPTEASETPTPTPTETETPEPEADTATVSRVIDGDTVELANGERVRLLGIDAPETGECHADTATQRMTELVQGQEVTLVRDGDDRDRYDRLLRYIDVDGTDAGFTLIQEGLAVSRYDSRDGYGFHVREPDYIAADQATAMQTCAPPPAQEAPTGDCDPNYRPCVPVYPPDINCSDITFPVEVIGSDPHGLDADGDGIGCEGNR